MQKIAVISGLLLLLINVLAHFVFPSYSTFSCGLSSAFILIGIILLIVIAKIKLKDGFRYSLNTFISFGTLVEFVLCILSPDRIENNFCFIIAAIMVIIQAILIFITNYMSKKIN